MSNKRFISFMGLGVFVLFLMVTVILTLTNYAYENVIEVLQQYG